MYFFEKHWEELLKFSRRTHRQMEQWANRYGYKDTPMEILDHAKKGFRGFRYTAVNLTNGANLMYFFRSIRSKAAKVMHTAMNWRIPFRIQDI